MIDFHIAKSLKEELSDIQIFPSEYEYDELLDIVETQSFELCCSEFITFVSEFERGLQTYQNLFSIEEYISKHGVDSTISELIGNESLIETIGTAISGFAKWLYQKLQQFCHWIRRLFSTDNERVNFSTTKNSKQFYNAMMASSTGFNSATKALAEYKKSIKAVHCKVDLERIFNLFDKFQDSGIGFDIITTLQYDFNKLKAYESNLKQIYQEFVSGEFQSISGPNAFVMFTGIGLAITKLRSMAQTTGYKLEQVIGSSKLDYKQLTEKQATTFVEKIISSFHLKHDKTQSSVIGNLKQIISSIRTICVLIYRIDIKFRPIGISLVDQFLNHPNTDISDYFVTKGVDISVKLPKEFAERLSHSWGSSVVIKRVVVSNSRGSANLGIQYAAATLAKVNAPAVDVYINYNWFTTNSVFKEIIKANEEDSKSDSDTHETSRHFLDALGDRKHDRVKTFLVLLVHEIRHCWQSQHNKLKLTEVRKATSNFGKDYDQSSHERDARNAEIQYEPTESDITWATKLLETIFKTLTNRR